MLFEGGAADRPTVEPYTQSDRPWPEHGLGDGPPAGAGVPLPPTSPPAQAPPTASAHGLPHAPAPVATHPHAAPPVAGLPASPPPAPAAAAPAQLPTAPAPPQGPLAVAPPPAPAPPFPAAVPEPPAPPVHRVVVRLAGGEHVEVATHEDQAAARAEATALMRYLRDGTGDWPFVAGRFLRPETIVSVDVASSTRA